MNCGTMRIIAKAVQNKLCGLSQNFLQKVQERELKRVLFICVRFSDRDRRRYEGGD